jgi:hypothetical protein
MPDGYVVRDANDQALVYIFSRDSEAEARQAGDSPLKFGTILDEANDEAAQLGILDARECPDQGQAIGGGQKVVHVSRR